MTAGWRKVGLLTVVLASVAWGEKVANPEYEGWSRFKPGAMVKLESRSVANERVITSVTTHKLIEVSAEKLVIETTSTIKAAGQSMESPVVLRDVPAEIDKVPPDPNDPMPAPEVEETQETVTVNGREYACKVLTVTSEHAGTRSVTTTWTTPDVPGGIVRTEVVTTGTVASTNSQRLVEVSTGE